MPMASSTVAGHASRALDFYNTKDLYFGLGKTTSWSSESTPTSTLLTNDDNPPEPTASDTLLEVIGYKKVESKFLVYPDDSGELEFSGRKWKIVTNPDDAISLGARWVYLASWIKYDEFPTDCSYRQVGILSGLKAKDSVAPGKTNLLTHEVEDAGILQAIYNKKPIYRDASQRELLTAVLTF